MNVGRNGDARPYCQLAHAMRPRSSPIEWRYAESLMMRGKSALAEQAIGQASRDYPDNGLVRLAKFDILGFGEAYQRAEPLLPAMLNQSEGFADQEVSALKAYLLARKSGNARDADRAAAALRSATVDGKLRIDVAVRALQDRHRVRPSASSEKAVAAADRPGAREFGDVVPVLARHRAASRADPRFWAVAKQQGLVGYWMNSGKWPDFCGKEQPLRQCKQLAAKARATA